MIELEHMTGANPLSHFGKPYDIYKRDNSNEKTNGFEMNPLLHGILQRRNLLEMKKILIHMSILHALRIYVALSNYWGILLMR